MWAAARDLGTQIYWDNCDITDNDTFVDHKCNIIEDEEKLNCKLYPTEKNMSKLIKLTTMFIQINITSHFRGVSYYIILDLLCPGND